MSLLIKLCDTEVGGVLVACALIIHYPYSAYTHTGGENKFILVDEQRINEKGISGTKAKLQTEKGKTNVVLYIPDKNQPKIAELRTESNVSTYSTIYTNQAIGC